MRNADSSVVLPPKNEAGDPTARGEGSTLPEQQGSYAKRDCFHAHDEQKKSTDLCRFLADPQIDILCHKTRQKCSACNTGSTHFHKRSIVEMWSRGFDPRNLIEHAVAKVPKSWLHSRQQRAT